MAKDKKPSGKKPGRPKGRGGTGGLGFTPGKKPCRTCDGTGSVGDKVCTDCDGTGEH